MWYLISTTSCFDDTQLMARFCRDVFLLSGGALENLPGGVIDKPKLRHGRFPLHTKLDNIPDDVPLPVAFCGVHVPCSHIASLAQSVGNL
jgi:hypothetical protein